MISRGLIPILFHLSGFYHMEESRLRYQFVLPQSESRYVTEPLVRARSGGPASFALELCPFSCQFIVSNQNRFDPELCHF